MPNCVFDHWQHWPRRAANDPATHLSPITQWYFSDETVAHNDDDGLPIWLAGREDLVDCQLRNWQHAELADGRVITLQLTPKIASNRSWVNEATLTFLQQRPVLLRGNWLPDRETFNVRVIWPQDFLLCENAAPFSGDIDQQIKTDQRDANAAFSVQRLWQQHPCEGDEWVLGLMLNGAQGDDDEAHGGHFAVVLGQLRQQSMENLLVANFYNPDVVSEKGILPAITPLPNYLAELNSGQQYYRPSSMMVLRLRQAGLLPLLYDALQQQMQAMYQHQWIYDHAFMNCTGISMDALRGSGLHVSRRGSLAWLAPFAYLLTLLKEHDRTRAKRVFRYLCSERTRLFPAQAFIASTQHLLSLLRQRRAPTSAFERALLQDAIAFDYVRLPQFPSSRAWGREPLFSLQDYQDRMPRDRADWKIIPVNPRHFPVEWLPSRSS